MTDEWLKQQMDRLRSEASRGPVSSITVFALTDPIMDSLARKAAPAFYPCCGHPSRGAHNGQCTFYGETKT